MSSGRGIAALVLLACTMFGDAPTVRAQDDEDGSFQILSAALELRGGTFFLDALADLELSAESRDALASGLPLTITYELEFLNRLRLWWDLEEETVRQRYQIQFHALTERYLVTDLNDGTQAPYSSLTDALSDIGRIEDVPTVAVADLDDDLRYEVRLRVVLDTERLPGPLRLLAFWRRDWALNSGWTVWRLDEE